MAYRRAEQYARCIEILQELIKDEEIRVHAMKLLGEVSFQLYNQIRFKSSPVLTGACLKYAQQAVSLLGAAYDEKVVKDRDPEAVMLDVALVDIILGKTEGSKSHVLCALCRRRCQKGEKLINSHIWANCFLQDFAGSSQAPHSKKIFDNISKEYGQLQSPGQISYPMLCKKCEDKFSQYEKAFKSNFFDLVYNNPEYAVNPKEIAVKLKCKTGHGSEDGEWLYRFCLSMIFRALGLAVHGSMKFCGNTNEVHKLFVDCRNLLLEESALENIERTKPQIAIYFTPVHMMLVNETNISPALQSIILSKGMSITSDFSFLDGKELPHGKVEYILCSIGAINIIAAVKDFYCVNIPPDCLITPSQSQFIIPSAFRRYLMFPRGLRKTFEYLATLKAKRVLHAPNKAFEHKDHVWAIEELESYLTSQAEIMSVQSFDKPQGEETNRMRINLLPSPYTGIRMPAHVKDISLHSVVIHSNSMLDSEYVCKSALVLKKPLNEHTKDSVFALLNIMTNNCNVWNGYILSTENNISIQGPLRENEVDIRVFRKLEEVFNTRYILEQQLQAAIKKVGFTTMTQFALWINYCW